MSMDEKECYLDKLFFLGICEGISCPLFYTDWVGTERGDTLFTDCGRDVFGDVLHTDAVTWCFGVATHKSV